MIGCRRDTPACQPIEGPSGRQGGETTLAVSSDGRTLASGGQDRRVLRWDVSTKRSLEPALHQDSPVGAIALTPDGRTVITGRRGGRLHIWDAETERGFDLPPQGTEVESLAVSPDGRVLASGTEGGVVRLWDTSLLGPIGQTCKFAGAVTALAFDPRGRVVAIGGEDGTIRLREVPHQKALGPPFRVDHPVRTLTFGHDGQSLLIRHLRKVAMVGFDRSYGRRAGPRSRRSVGRRAVEPGRGRDRQPRRSDPGHDQAHRGGRSDPRPCRVPGCGYGEASARDARSSPRHLGPGLQPRLEMAPDLGARAGHRSPLGRGHLARLAPLSFIPWIPPFTRPSSAGTAGACCWVAVMVGLGCGTRPATSRSIPRTARAMPTRSPPSPSTPNARGW